MQKYTSVILLSYRHKCIFVIAECTEILPLLFFKTISSSINRSCGVLATTLRGLLQHILSRLLWTGNNTIQGHLVKTCLSDENHVYSESMVFSALHKLHLCEFYSLSFQLCFSTIIWNDATYPCLKSHMKIIHMESFQQVMCLFCYKIGGRWHALPQNQERSLWCGHGFLFFYFKRFWNFIWQNKDLQDP